MILLNVGFIHDLSPEQIRDVARGLTYLYNHQKDVQLWDEKLQGYSEVVRDRVHAYWARLVEEEKLDIVGNAYERSKSKARKRIDVDTMRHTDAREVGCEWLCLQTIRKLGLDTFLRSLGWSEDKVKRHFGPSYYEGGLYSVRIKVNIHYKRELCSVRTP